MYYFILGAVFILFAFIVIVCDRKYFMLRDNSTALPRPYSFSRAQLTWWTVIVLSSMISIILCRDGSIPDFNNSTLYLLGISSATTVGATLIDINDETNPNLTGLNQNIKGDNFFLDIVSDKNGVSIHRFQTVVFNIVFGVWFIRHVLMSLGNNKIDFNHIMPVISENNLVLLGVSSGVYAVLKATENKQGNGIAQQPPVIAPNK